LQREAVGNLHADGGKIGNSSGNRLATRHPERSAVYPQLPWTGLWTSAG
jgi:hypothetical protein